MMEAVIEEAALDGFDTLPGGPSLAVGVEFADPATMTGQDTTAWLRAGFRVRNHFDWLLLRALRVACSARADTTERVPADEFTPKIAAANLGWSSGAAAARLEVAVGVLETMPALGERLRRGDLELAKATAFVTGLEGLTPEQCAEVLDGLLDEAPEIPLGKLRERILAAGYAVDPVWGANRLAAATARARVTRETAPSGAVNLAGRDLPPELAQDAAHRLRALALAVRARLRVAGRKLALGFIEARVFVRLIDGTLAGADDTTVIEALTTELTTELTTTDEPHPGPDDDPDDETPDDPGPDDGGPSDNGPDDETPDDPGPDDGEPDDNGPDENGPDENGPDENGPDENGPDDDQGPDDQGPDGQGPDDDGPDDSDPGGGPDDGPDDDGGPDDGPDDDGPGGGDSDERRPVDLDDLNDPDVDPDIGEPAAEPTAANPASHDPAAGDAPDEPTSGDPASGEATEHGHGPAALVGPQHSVVFAPGTTVSLPLSTLLGLDHRPGTLTGTGPVPAHLARAAAYHRGAAAWQVLVHDRDGHLTHLLALRAPPDAACDPRHRRQTVQVTAPAELIHALDPTGEGTVELPGTRPALLDTAATSWLQHVRAALVASETADPDEHPATTTRDRDRRFPGAALARWIAARDQTCIAPGCTRPAAVCDIDHTRDWLLGGVTEAAGLDLLCRHDHRAKHHSGWRYEQPEPGRFVITDPTGTVHHVTSRVVDPLPAPLTPGRAITPEPYEPRARPDWTPNRDRHGHITTEARDTAQQLTLRARHDQGTPPSRYDHDPDF